MVGGHGSGIGKHQEEGLPHSRCSVIVRCCYHIWKCEFGGSLQVLKAGQGWLFLGDLEVL